MTLILFIISLGFALLIFTKYKVYSLYFLISHYFLIDLYNYKFGNDDALTFLSKSYREILLVFLFFYFFLNIEKLKKQYVSSIVLVILIIILLGVGAYYNGFSNAVLDWRYTLSPILIALLLSISGILNLEILRKISTFLLLLVTLNSFIIIIQYYSFDGNFQGNWRYDFLNEQNLKINPEYIERMTQYQIVRGDELRSSGVFLSALHAAYITALISVYSFICSILEIKNYRFFYFFIFLTNFIALYLTQVRVGFLIIILSLISFSMCVFLKKYTPRSVIIILIISTILFVSLLFLNQDMLDESILGRIPQYLYLFENFNLFGHGLGSYYGKFDSYYVNGFLTFGILFAFWILYIIREYINIFSDLSYSKNSILVLAYCSIIPALLFSLMQHFIGSLYYLVIWFLLFGLIRYKYELKKIK